MNTGDTAFMLTATALVMLMTPGLALFYGGLVRQKNVLATIMQSFACLGLVSIIWIGYGYSLVFGPDIGGFIGSLEWAGGTVIHINSACAALAAAFVLGRRKGWGREPFHPHNLPMTILGAGILWFGWFGFNAGSALSASSIAVLAFFTTQIATGAGLLSWILTEWKIQGKPTTLGAASGALAGLVAITPAAGFVGPLSAIVIGFVAGSLCYLAVLMKNRLGYDDALDVVGVHGVGGLWGALATGLFASTFWNPDGANGLFLAIHTSLSSRPLEPGPPLPIPLPLVLLY